MGWLTVAIQVTRWSPDTCNCVIDFSWDDTQNETVRTHSLDNVNVIGPEHIGLSATQIWQTVMDENRRKNETFGFTLQVLPSAQPKDFSFYYSAGRILHVSLTIPITNQKKQQIQNFCDTTFGGGKVIVE